MQELVKQTVKLDLLVKEENRKRARFFTENDQLNLLEFSSDSVEKLHSLWDDPAIQKAWERAPEFQMQTTMMDYLMEHLPRFTSEGFIPTNEDMLRARQRTTGAVETIFEIDKTEWKLLDCGGQKPERAKWETFLTENPVNAIIFFVALEEFNTLSSEEEGRTKMQITVQCFQEIIASEKTKSTTIVLFLNKRDLFEKKLNKLKDFKAFKETFPKYTGENELQPATEFIGNIYRQIMKDGGRSSEDLVVHVTCALDTDAMETVFQAVRETLFMNNMLLGGVKM